MGVGTDFMKNTKNLNSNKKKHGFYKAEKFIYLIIAIIYQGV
jgi:hypothetical protein